MESPKICISMFGGLSVTIGEKVLIESTSRPSKLWETFVILAMTRKSPISNDELMEYLWAGDESTNPPNALKNAIYCLRRDAFEDMGDGVSVILFSNGRYCLNPEINFTVDVEEFERLYAASSECIDKSVAQINYYRMINMYNTGFVPSLTYSSYVAPWNAHLKEIYVGVCNKLCTILLEKGNADAATDVCISAFSIESLNQELYTNLLRAFEIKKQYSAIINAYHQISHYFSLELQVDLCDDIKRIYNNACANAQLNLGDIEIINSELSQQLHQTSPVKKAYYCGYDVLKHMCAVKAHDAVRANKQIGLILLSLVNDDESQIEPCVLANLMEQLKTVILGSLRKGDLFSKYTKSQYVLVLVSDSLEKLCNTISDRVYTKFATMSNAKGIKIVATSMPLK